MIFATFCAVCVMVTLAVEVLCFDILLQVLILNNLEASGTKLESRNAKHEIRIEQRADGWQGAGLGQEEDPRDSWLEGGTSRSSRRPVRDAKGAFGKRGGKVLNLKGLTFFCAPKRRQIDESKRDKGSRGDKGSKGVEEKETEGAVQRVGAGFAAAITDHISASVPSLSR